MHDFPPAMGFYHAAAISGGVASTRYCFQFLPVHRPFLKANLFVPNKHVVRMALESSCSSRVLTGMCMCGARDCCWSAFSLVLYSPVLPLPMMACCAF